MPNPTQTPADPFLETILVHLTKVFLPSTNRDPVAAREAALRTLESYNCETQPEQLLASNAIAFSIQALETYNQALTPGISPSLAKRFNSCAASLCREATNLKDQLAQLQSKRRALAPAPEPQPARITWTAAYQDTQRKGRMAAYRKASAQLSKEA